MPTPLEQALAPFINARLNPVRDENGYIIPRSHAVDIYQGRIAHIDASVRGVSDEGITVFFDSRCETIAWAEITSVQIVRKGDCRLIEQSFRSLAKLARAA